MAIIWHYLGVFEFKKVFECKTNRLAWFDPIPVTNTKTNVQFFPKKIQLNNLPKLNAMQTWNLNLKLIVLTQFPNKVVFECYVASKPFLIKHTAFISDQKAIYISSPLKKPKSLVW